MCFNSAGTKTFHTNEVSVLRGYTKAAGFNSFIKTKCLMLFIQDIYFQLVVVVYLLYQKHLSEIIPNISLFGIGHPVPIHTTL